MATLGSTIQLNDRFTAPMMGIINAINLGLGAMESLHDTMEDIVDTSGLDAAKRALGEASEAAQLLGKNIRGIDSPTDENTRSQNEHNKSLQESGDSAGALLQKIQGVIAAYAGMQTLKLGIDVSGQLASAKARIHQMNDGLQSTEDLMDAIYDAAQEARGDFFSMAGVVARFGNNARDAFSSSAEVVEFAELVQKQMVIAGAGTQEASNAMLQLSQALGSGVLRGDELNSIFEQAPNLIRTIADDLDVPIGSIRQMASEGQLTADIVKNAIMGSADEINQKFEEMPMTFDQLGATMKNSIVHNLFSALNHLNSLANAPGIRAFAENAVMFISMVLAVATHLVSLLVDGANFVAQNWGTLEPIFAGLVTVFGLYVAAMVAYNTVAAVSTGITMAKAFAQSVAAAATTLQSGATLGATIAQHGLNAALLACPITWIVLAIIGLVAGLLAAANAVAEFTGEAESGLGIIAGGINVVIQFFVNLYHATGTVFLAMEDAGNALGNNMVVAFDNSIRNIQSFFYNLLATAVSVISQIAEKLSKLPFVEFDAAGLQSSANNYAEKARALQEGKGTYKDVGAAFKQRMDTMTAFSGGWASDAFKKGAEWGDGMSKKIGDGINGLKEKLLNFGSGYSIPASSGGYGGMGNSIGALSDAANKAASGAGDTAKNTDAINKQLDVTLEELKYLRDAAEVEAINRFTTAQINIDMSGMKNSVTGISDVDFVGVLVEKVQEVAESMTEVVHV